MWVMDFGMRIWEYVDVGFGFGFCYFYLMDVWEDKFVCFGGMLDFEFMLMYNDIWFFDCIFRRWIF